MPAAALGGHPPMVKTNVPGVCAGRRGGAGGRGELRSAEESQSGGEMTHLWSPWRGSCTRQGGQHTVEARYQADPLSHCAALCRPCCTTAAACPHHRRHCPHAGAGYLDARQRAKLTRSVVNSAKKTCVREIRAQPDPPRSSYPLRKISLKQEKIPISPHFSRSESRS